MSNDLSTLDLDTLSTVSGGLAKKGEAELKTAMTQIKDSLSSLKKQAATPASDPSQMMMMMMMMKNR
jgi:hypothetical protein